MTAPTILQVMQGIETRLATVTGLNTSESHPGQITTPMAVVGVPPVDNYHVSMRNGTMDLTVPVLILVSAALDTVGQQALAAYANPTGSSSIKAAIEADRTLGGVVDDCYVQSFAPLGIDEVNTIGYWGGRFTLYVAAGGS